MPNIFGPNRQSTRLKDYDYASQGMYYVTICTQDRLMLFGDVKNEAVHLSSVGEMIQKVWEGMPCNDSRIGLDEFIVMPNHFHGVVVLLEFRADVTLRAGPRFLNFL